MGLTRQCSRTGCVRPAVATLTYVYGDSTVVLGPLATYAEPHSYDLCPGHAEGLTAPRGWQVVRLSGHYEPASCGDDLLAVADAVRESGTRGCVTRAPEATTVEAARHRHLRILREL